MEPFCRGEIAATERRHGVASNPRRLVAGRTHRHTHSNGAIAPASDFEEPVSRPVNVRLSLPFQTNEPTLYLFLASFVTTRSLVSVGFSGCYRYRQIHFILMKFDRFSNQLVRIYLGFLELLRDLIFSHRCYSWPSKVDFHVDFQWCTWEHWLTFGAAQ